MSKTKQNKLINCFRDGVDDLVFWSFRYFLGRRTIAACCFTGELASAYPLLKKHTQDLVKRELEEAFAEDDKMRADPARSMYYPLGADCDREAWTRVRESYITYGLGKTKTSKAKAN